MKLLLICGLVISWKADLDQRSDLDNISSGLLNQSRHACRHHHWMEIRIPAQTFPMQIIDGALGQGAFLSPA